MRGLVLCHPTATGLRSENFPLKMSVEDNVESVASVTDIKPDTSADINALNTEKIECATELVQTIDKKDDVAELQVTYVESKGETIDACGDEVVQELVTEVLETASANVAEDSGREETKDENNAEAVTEVIVAEVDTKPGDEEKLEDQANTDESTQEKSDVVEEVTEDTAPSMNAELRENPSVPEQSPEVGSEQRAIDDAAEVVTTLEVHSEKKVEVSAKDENITPHDKTKEVAKKSEQEIAAQQPKEKVVCPNVEARNQVSIGETAFTQ
jgi:hypothetical protein